MGTSSNNIFSDSDSVPELTLFKIRNNTEIFINAVSLKNLF